MESQEKRKERMGKKNIESNHGPKLPNVGKDKHLHSWAA